MLSVHVLCYVFLVDGPVELFFVGGLRVLPSFLRLH